MSQTATAKEQMSLHQHKDAVTCLDVSYSEDILMVSGSADTTLLVRIHTHHIHTFSVLSVTASILTSVLIFLIFIIFF